MSNTSNGFSRNEKYSFWPWFSVLGNVLCVKCKMFRIAFIHLCVFTNFVIEFPEQDVNSNRSIWRISFVIVFLCQNSPQNWIFLNFIVNFDAFLSFLFYALSTAIKALSRVTDAMLHKCLNVKMTIDSKKIHIINKM